MDIFSLSLARKWFLWFNPSAIVMCCGECSIVQQSAELSAREVDNGLLFARNSAKGA